MPRLGFAVGLASALAALYLSLAASAIGQETPDLTGIWMHDGQRSGRWPDELPYTSAGRAAVTAFEENYPGNSYDPGRFCVFLGMPETMFGGGYWTELIQRPERLTIVFELSKPPRRIYTDGRGHPGDLYPTENGHSVGRWEGDTLVVETTGIVARDGPVPNSDELRVVERLRIEQDDAHGLTLVDEITVHDPVMFNEPVVMSQYFTAWPDDDLLEYQCMDGPWRDYLRELEAERTSE